MYKTQLLASIPKSYRFLKEGSSLNITIINSRLDQPILRMVDTYIINMADIK